MKRFISGLVCALSLCAFAVAGAAEGPLPFAVTLGGQGATYKAGEAFAQVEKPVAADAAIKVESKADLTIINVHKTAADGQPDPAAQPGIILLQGTKEGTLAQTMDKQKLAPGAYLLSVSSGEETATIKFTIK